MKLLLDTHIWLWLTLAPNRLSRRVAHALDETSNELWLSPISVWELLTLTRKGRIRLSQDPVAWARESFERLALREATLTTDVALETSSLGLAHSDPADRLIAASAKVFDLTLVTADEQLIAEPGIKVLADR
jgi:PIN domain nuclease of toxin-antitoxin system